LNKIRIQLKKIGTQIGGKTIQNLLVNMVLEKKLEKTQIQKGIFLCLFT
jgi:hypothetical protein